MHSGALARRGRNAIYLIRDRQHSIWDANELQWYVDSAHFRMHAWTNDGHDHHPHLLLLYFIHHHDHQPDKCVGVKVKWWPWHFALCDTLWPQRNWNWSWPTHHHHNNHHHCTTLEIYPRCWYSPSCELLDSFEATETSSKRQSNIFILWCGTCWREVLVGWWDTQGRVIHQQSEFSRYAPSPPLLHPCQHLHWLYNLCIANKGRVCMERDAHTKSAEWIFTLLPGRWERGAPKKQAKLALGPNRIRLRPNTN